MFLDPSCACYSMKTVMLSIFPYLLVHHRMVTYLRRPSDEEYGRQALLMRAAIVYVLLDVRQEHKAMQEKDVLTTFKQ